MRISLRQPRADVLEHVLTAARDVQPTPVLGVGALDLAEPPHKYRFGHTRERVGRGLRDYESAEHALAEWTFLPRWAGVYPQRAPQAAGDTVLITSRTLGLWCVLPARIIETIDTPNRHGFVYAALPGHVATGIERFVVEHDAATDEVTFELKAVARPAYLLLRLARPGFTVVQRAFRRDCMRQMRRAVGGT